MGGRLEFICGPMFSGKTEELIRRINAFKKEGRRVQVFKHAFDTRFDAAAVVTHGGESIPAVPISSACAFLEQVCPESECVCIDEVQFFDHAMFYACVKFVREGRTVVAAGLDLDFRGEPFGLAPLFLAGADQVVKKAGTCSCCGAPARFSQRVTHGEPAQWCEQQVLVAGNDRYEARCWRCVELFGKYGIGHE